MHHPRSMARCRCRNAAPSFDKQQRLTIESSFWGGSDDKATRLQTQSGYDEVVKISDLATLQPAMLRNKQTASTATDLPVTIPESGLLDPQLSSSKSSSMAAALADWLAIPQRPHRYITETSLPDRRTAGDITDRASGAERATAPPASSAQTARGAAPRRAPTDGS